MSDDEDMAVDDTNQVRVPFELDCFTLFVFSPLVWMMTITAAVLVVAATTTKQLAARAHVKNNRSVLCVRVFGIAGKSMRVFCTK